MNHKTALVTGASSGIGLAICHELAKLKYNLLLISNDEAGLKNAKAIIYAKHGINCIVYCEDLSKQEAAKNIVEFCTKNNLDIEVLINNAGILVFSEVAFAKDTDVSKILQLHINTPTFLCNYFSKEMVKNKKGYILNVSSISAVMPYPFISLYGPSKTYMRYFTKNRIEFAKCICYLSYAWCYSYGII
jgi:short-subunit dehydrogenase